LGRHLATTVSSPRDKRYSSTRGSCCPRHPAQPPLAISRGNRVWPFLCRECSSSPLWNSFPALFSQSIGGGNRERLDCERLDYKGRSDSYQIARLITFFPMRRTMHLRQPKAKPSQRIREALFLLQLEQVTGVYHFTLSWLIFHHRVPRASPPAYCSSRPGADPRPRRTPGVIPSHLEAAENGTQQEVLPLVRIQLPALFPG
jgi:hypothetical protein